MTSNKVLQTQRLSAWDLFQTHSYEREKKICTENPKGYRNFTQIKYLCVHKKEDFFLHVSLHQSKVLTTDLHLAHPQYVSKG